eukprot:gene103-3495_t
MGGTTSRDGVPVVWGATTHRGKKEYDKAQLQKLDEYLNDQIDKLRRHMKSLREVPGAWQAEFAQVSKTGLGTPAVASQALENTNKNRYHNIVAYDHTRVKITPEKHNFHNDYINANFLPGYNKKNAYIATQGPVPDTFPDFWQMLWEQNVSTIVMVTSEVEGGRLKCHRYWPELNQSVDHGQFTVTSKFEQATRNHIHRTFILLNNETNEQYPVDHLQFILWPDHGVPNTSSEILAFRDEIYRVHDPNTPLAVHCSAGVGRTGTYISIDWLICAAENLDPDLNVLNVVCELRRSRNFMVQTMIQYGFVYLSLHEALVKGHNQVKQGLAKIEELNEELMKDELQELTDNIDEVMEEVQGYANEQMNREVADLRQQTRGSEKAAGEEFQNIVQENDTDDPSSHATTVSVVERMESFMFAVTQHKEGNNQEARSKVEVDWMSLKTRIQSLEEQAADAFKEQYSSAESAWKQGDEYYPMMEMTPIESRVAAYAAQQEAWKMRGPEFRKQVQDDSLRQLATLKARLENFQDSLVEAERKAFTTRKQSLAKLEDDFKENVTLLERVRALAVPNAAGTSFGRIVDTPESHKKQKKKKKKDKKKQEPVKVPEPKPEQPPEQPPEPEHETPKPQEKLPAEGEIIDSSQPQKFHALKSPTPKEASLHPMVAQMAKGKVLVKLPTPSPYEISCLYSQSSRTLLNNSNTSMHLRESYL